MKKASFLICILAVLMALSSCKKKSSEKQILEFRFSSPDIEATIDESLKTVEALVPYGTDVTALKPIIVVSDRATISPESDVPMDFNNPVTYTVSAEDGSQTEYIVTVNVESAEKAFIGIWGVDRIEYYNIDYAGNPIVSTLTTEDYDPYDINSGLQLVFREDHTGEVRDNSVDTIWSWNPETDSSYIVCPDTTLVTRFTYSFDLESFVLFMDMEDSHPWRLKVVELNPDVFVYENEYAQSYVEKAYLRRISNIPDKSKSICCSNQKRPYKEGPLLRR